MLAESRMKRGGLNVDEGGLGRSFFFVFSVRPGEVEEINHLGYVDFQSEIPFRIGKLFLPVLIVPLLLTKQWPIVSEQREISGIC